MYSQVLSKSLCFFLAVLLACSFPSAKSSQDTSTHTSYNLRPSTDDHNNLDGENKKRRPKERKATKAQGGADDADYGDGIYPHFRIELINFGSPSKYDTAMYFAASIWETFINNDLTDIPGGVVPDWFHDSFGEFFYDGPIDDVVIGYEMGEMDGMGGTIGIAAPTFIRSTGVEGDKFLPPLATASGIMMFDVDDFERGTMIDAMIIATHGMAQVLGVGLYWDNICGADCASSGDVSYTCPVAQEKYKEMAIPGKALKIQGDGDDITKCINWDADSFQNDDDPMAVSELMTGMFDQGHLQFLSPVTVGALADLGGYSVSFDCADPLPTIDGPPPALFTNELKKFGVMGPFAPTYSFEITAENLLHVPGQTALFNNREVEVPKPIGLFE